MHSVAGAGSDTDMRRFTVVRSETSKSILESKLIDAVVTGDLEAIKQLRDEVAEKDARCQASSKSASQRERM